MQNTQQKNVSAPLVLRTITTLDDMLQAFVARACCDRLLTLPTRRLGGTPSLAQFVFWLSVRMTKLSELVMRASDRLLCKCSSLPQCLYHPRVWKQRLAANVPRCRSPPTPPSRARSQREKAVDRPFWPTLAASNQAVRCQPCQVCLCVLAAGVRPASRQKLPAVAHNCGAEPHTDLGENYWKCPAAPSSRSKVPAPYGAFPAAPVPFLGLDRAPHSNHQYGCHSCWDLRCMPPQKIACSGSLSGGIWKHQADFPH